MASIVDLKNEWAAAIGKVFVAFGSIEYVTVACLKEIPRDRIQRTTKTFRLGQRIELLLELLEPYDVAEYIQLSTMLRRASELAATRNLIAHNPLVMDFFKRRDGSMFTREVIAHLHRDKHITLAELQLFASECESLATELHRCSSAVFIMHRAANT